MSLYSKVIKIVEKIIFKWYKHTLPSKIKRIREKESIKVLFVLAETSKWKTEYLYKAMLRHKRFDPILGITMKTDDKPSESAKKLFELIDYLNSHNYDYQELIREGYIKEKINPDIIIYEEPYSSTILRGHNYLNNLNSVFISITYGFHSTLLPFNNIGGLKEIAWFDCYENKSTALDAIKYTKGKRKNIVVTGLPMSEGFLKYDNNDKLVWKKTNCLKKIIWAPHHSIGFEYETITYGFFLEIAEFMISLSEKYKNELQWAFKPHPLLRYKLELVWGKEKTDKYFNYWKNNSWTQLEEGEYLGLFMESDAMIHDCDTFTIEYLYANKPALYLQRELHDNLNSFAIKAHENYYNAQTHSEIENFIKMVLRYEDPLKEKRTLFYNNELNIPEGNNASKNIINYILGNKI